MNDTIPPLHKRHFHILGQAAIGKLMKEFSATEKLIFTIFTALATLSVIAMLWTINRSFLVPVPARGGELIEGVVGIPRFINPILALTDVDRDLTNLVHAGLMRYDGNKLVPNIAESYTASDDGLIYTFIIREDAQFHDGSLITPDDVEFTIKKAQDSALKSPKRANWENVTVEKTGPRSVSFILKKPYGPFLENTTIGILPRAIWKNVDVEQFTFSQFNVEPVGAGPYRISEIKRDSGGLPLYYELTPFEDYTGGVAYISSLIIRFYPNERDLLDAYNEGIVDSMSSISPKEAQRLTLLSPHVRIERSALPRIFGVFFNQSEAPVLADLAVRQALNAAVNKDRIVSEILAGYGVPIDGPLPATGATSSRPVTISAATSSDGYIAAAQNILEKAGWTPNADGIYEKKTKTSTQTLEFSISTSNAAELKRASEILKEQWEKMGANVTLRIFETGDLNQNVIRPRKYDALFFGEIIGRDLDLFAFWHSSQRNDPGLNIGMYVNSKADTLLETARTIQDPDERLKKFRELEGLIEKDAAAVFIYSPEFIYIVPEDLKGLSIGHMTTADDRWNNVQYWYIKTDNVWKIFTDDHLSQTWNTAWSTVRSAFNIKKYFTTNN